MESFGGGKPPPNPPSRKSYSTCVRRWLSHPGAMIVTRIKEGHLQSNTNTPGQASGAPTAGTYALVNGINLYYEIHGSGAPLILLHGGVSASEAFGPNLAELAKTRQVIAVHLQGHGRTRDIDRPLRCEFMADDIAALIAHLGFE